MKHDDLIKIMNKMKMVFCEKKLNALGKSIGFSKRERIITPGRLALSLIKSFSCNKVETIADVQRCFNGMFDKNIAYKPFHNQLAKQKFSEFMRELTTSVLEHMVTHVLSFKQSNALSEFKSIYIQDGTSFGVKKNFVKNISRSFHQGNARCSRASSNL